MTNKSLINHFFKASILILIILTFIILIDFDVKAALFFSLAFLLLSFALVNFTKITEKNFFLIFFFLYPLLPGVWGLNLPLGLPVLRAHRVAIMIMLLYLAMNGLFFKYYGNFIKSRLFNLPLAFLMLSMFVSSFLSSAKGSSIFFTCSMILEYFILSVVVYNAFPKRSDLESLVNVLCYSAIILGLLGIYEKYAEYNIYSIFGAYRGIGIFEFVMRDGTIRTMGPFGHSISFGSYFALLSPLILYKYRDEYLKFYLFILIIFIAMMGSQSRGAAIGTYVAIILYFIFINRKQIKLAIFASIPFFILFFNRIFVHFREMLPFSTTDPSLIASTIERTRQFDYYVGIIKKNIFFGHGLDPAPPLMRNFLGPGGTIIYATSIDNFYLGFSYQFGIIGLISWCFLMLQILFKPIYLYKKSIFNDKLVLSLLSGIIIFNIINYIVFLFHYHFVFWLYLGMITRLLSIKKNQEREKALTLINVNESEKLIASV